MSDVICSHGHQSRGCAICAAAPLTYAAQFIREAQRSAQPTITKWVVCHSVEEMRSFYYSLLAGLRNEARRLGYALAHHGSMRRDMDLICVPWIDGAVDRDELARGLQDVACGMPSANYTWEQKPHGRMATSFPICWCDWQGCRDVIGLGHIDLSVVGEGGMTCT